MFLYNNKFYKLKCMETTDLKEKYRTVLALFVYTGILVPLLALVCGLDLPFIKTWWFMAPVIAVYAIAAIWIAFRFKFQIAFKILWFLSLLFFLRYMVKSVM